MALKKSVNKPVALVDDDVKEAVPAEAKDEVVADVGEVSVAATAASETKLRAEEVKSSVNETESATEVTSATGTTVVTSSDNPNRRALSTASSSFVEQAADAGMDGLEIGYGSFPTVKLDDGDFVDGDGNNYPSPFYFTPISSRGVLAYSQKGEEDGDVFFSYDGITTTKNESVAEKCKEWQEDGFEVEKDKRLEVDCLLMDEADGQFVEGEMVMLSLPPTARKKFSGKWAMASRAYANAGKGADQLIMKAEVGKSVKVGNRSFKPWLFGYVKP